MTASKIYRPPDSAAGTRVVLRVSAYEKTAGLLVALLLLFGLSTCILLLMWLASTVVLVRVATPLRPYPEGTPNDPGVVLDPDNPGVEELPITWEQPHLEAFLKPVTELASVVAAGDQAFNSDGQRSGGGLGRPGDNRPRGPDRHLIRVLPPWQRWQIRYSAHDVDEYARQLDYFGIELAAAGGSSAVDYAFQLSRDVPSTRQGIGKNEQRIYFTWRPGSQLREYDERLLWRAGIRTEGRVLMQLLPDRVEQELLRLEAENAQGRRPEEWLRTVFGVRKRGSDYEFFIIEQRFRPFPPQGSAASGTGWIAELQKLDESLPILRDFATSRL